MATLSILQFGPGPMEALQEYLKGNSDFLIDKSREKFFMTSIRTATSKKVKD